MFLLLQEWCGLVHNLDGSNTNAGVKVMISMNKKTTFLTAGVRRYLLSITCSLLVDIPRVVKCPQDVNRVIDIDGGLSYTHTVWKYMKFVGRPRGPT
jgi:hypothetical protein